MNKAKLSCIPILKDKQHHLNTTQVPQTPKQSYKNQVNKLLKNSQPYLCRRQHWLPHTPSTQEKHPFYWFHPHQPKKQSFQDHHHKTTVYTITNNVFQDHLKQQTVYTITNNAFQDHLEQKTKTTPTTTAKSVIPKPCSRIPHASTYRTTPTCTRTINSASFHILTCFATLSKPICQPTTIHTCSVRIKKQMKRRCKHSQVKR